MPGVLGQVGQSVADNLFEIGKSTVKGTVNAVTDVAHESIEQITLTPKQLLTPDQNKESGEESRPNKERKALERRRLEEVRAELDRYVQRKKDLDMKIAQEKAKQDEEQKQKRIFEEKKRDSWVNRIINRSQTTTERGRLME